MKDQALIFDQIVDKRRATRAFDTHFKLPETVVKRSLERAIKSPNSSNMQLWEFYRVKTQDAIDEVAKICLGQNSARTASEIVVFVARADLWKHRQQFHLALLDEEKRNEKDKSRFSKSAYNYYNRLMPFFYNAGILPFAKDFVKRIIIWNAARKKPFMRDLLSKFIPVVVHKSVGLAAQTFMLSITAEGFDSVPMEGLDSVRMKHFLKLPKGAEICMAIAVGKGLPEGISGPRVRLGYDEVVFDV